MSRSIHIFILSALFASIAPTYVAAQSLTDALRVSTEGIPIGARTLAMDGSTISAANDISALDINPAALAPITMNEISFSLWNRTHNSSANFFNTSSEASVSNTAFSSLGMIAPVPTSRGHLTIGLSYDKVRDYSTTYAFKAVNPNSSLFNTQGFVDQPNSSLTGSDYTDYLNNYNLAYLIGLTYNPDTITGKLTTPFGGGLEQSGVVTEDGGLSALRFGAGIDIAEGISAGATVNVLFGSYDYSRAYTERDVNGLFGGPGDSLVPLSFQSATITDSRHQDQTGISLKLGLLAYKSDLVRFGLTLETPTYLHIQDAFLRTGTANFVDGTVYSSGNATGIGSIINTYDVVTPLRASAGASLNFMGATLAGTVSYADMTQLRFTNSDVDLSDLNLAAKTELRSVLSWDLGAEYIIPIIGASIRAGYGDEPSAYKGDPSSYDSKSWSAGAGVLLSQSLLLEAAYRHNQYHTSHAIYNDVTVQGDPASANIDDDLVKQDDVALTLNYRF